MPAATGSICLATPELLGLTRNGGIGASYTLLAHLLAEHGWRVHILYCGGCSEPEALDTVRRELAGVGIGLTHLDECPLPPALQVHGIFPTSAAVTRSDRVFAALEQLHRQHRFDLIQFVDWLGYGFRPILAQRSRLAFANAGTIVKLHGMQQWVRELNQAWLSGADAALEEFAERQAFDHADFQVGASRYILDYARTLGWQVRDDAAVCPNPLGAAREVKRWEQDDAPVELVFFGRLERRKGYELFVHALDGIDPTVPIVFLGKDGPRQDGQPASAWVKERLPNRSVTFLTEYDRAAAIRYLASGNRVAVIPSLAENHPHAVAECVVNGIPFLAAHTGGIPEVVQDPQLQAQLLFEPSSADLRRQIQTYLQRPVGERRAWCDRLREQADVAAHNRRVVTFYERLLSTVRARRAGAARRQTPLVTVAVTHYNLGNYLPATLAALAAQTYPHLEVLVLDDGSTDPASVQVFEAMAAAYPHFRFIRQANAGLAATRNRALAEANGDYYCPFDADNLAMPAMIERLVAALEANPDWSAVTSYLLAFEDGANPRDGEAFAWAYRPTGGPLALGSLHNVYGDASGLFRTRTLRAVGGYDAQPGVILEDWHAYVKLVGAGHRVAVVPDHLLLYRVRPASMVRSGCEYAGRLRVVNECAHADHLPPAERTAVWTLLAGFEQRLHELSNRLHHAQVQAAQAQAQLGCLRHRVADRANTLLRAVPLLHPLGKKLVRLAVRTWRRRQAGRSQPPA